MSSIELLTTKEAAALLKVSTVTLAKWRQLSKGPAYTRSGRLIRYEWEALTAYVKQNTVGK
jgi:excisionase family DNA binding protein